MQPGAALVLAMALAALLGIRTYAVDSVVGAYTGCIGCMRLPAIGHDAWLLGAALALLACSWLIRSTFLQVALRLAFAVLVVVAAADLVLFNLLAQRLYLADVVRFGGEVGANWSVLRSSLHGPAGWLKMAAGAVLVMLMLMAILPDRRRPRLAMVLGGVAALCAIASMVILDSAPVHYVHASLTRNVLEINLSQSGRRHFSPGFIENERKKIANLPETCEINMAPTRPNVIIVLAESLSAWHSQLLGGPADWTPRLDAIARENHYFTNFNANGFSTSGAEIAVGSGRVPINPPGVFEYSFDNYATGTSSLPGMA
ncbi:MAG: sulfatase-like hydrolase/transferase, partial [Dokdonella sp.]